MKKIFLFALCLSLFSLKMLGQQSKQTPLEQIQSLKIAFLTKELSLTPEEAQKFWPVYNQYEMEMRKARLEGRKSKDEIEMEEKLIAIRKKYRTEFAKVLGLDRANQVFTAEKAFSRTIQKEIMDRRQQRLQQRNAPQR
jgi:hypothetical protein